MTASPLTVGQTWDGTNLSAWNDQSASTDSIGPRVVETVVDGRDCLALTAFDRDTALTENPRAQLLSPGIIEPGGVYQAAVGIKVPTGALPAAFPAGSWGVTLVQPNYGPPYAGASPLRIWLHDADLVELVYVPESVSVPLVREKWMDFEIAFEHAADGWVSFALNGETLVPQTSCATVNATNRIGPCSLYIDAYMAAGTSDRIGPIFFSEPTLTRIA